MYKIPPILLLQQHRNTKLPDAPANWSKLVCSWFKNQQTSKFLFQVKSYRFLSVKHLNPFFDESFIPVLYM